LWFARLEDEQCSPLRDERPHLLFERLVSKPAKKHGVARPSRRLITLGALAIGNCRSIEQPRALTMKRPDITTPNSLLSASARYKAPIFQRYYVWTKKEWLSLAEDLETADPAIGQFLGAIVLKDLGRPAGPASPSTYLLIDGQQRITTLYLVLLALAAQSEAAGDTDTANFIWRNYLAETKSPSFAGWPKVVPTLQDRHTFYEILSSAMPDAAWEFSADPEDKKPRTARRLQQQWQRIQKHVAVVTGAEAGEFDKKLLSDVLETVQEKLKLIDITLETQDDANAIFSRLNAKGVPLELADLVRNEVFSKFGPQDSAKAEKFFVKSWQPFEKALPEGSLSSFFPVYAYVVLKGKVTMAAAFGELQSAWKNKTPAQVLADVQKYSPFFALLTEFRKRPSLSKEANAQVERISRMPRTRVTWPFIIQVLRALDDRSIAESDALRSLRIVESFLVRRALLGREPTGLHAVFKVLWERTKGAPQEVLKRIVTRTILSPSDGEIWAFLTKERSDSRAILKFVLEEFERDYINANKYDPPPETIMTVEHVLPKNLSAPWAKLFTPAEHERCVGLLGNLAALSETQNKSLQDQSWADKKKRFSGSNFKTTQQLSQSREWRGKDIDQRTREIITWLIKRWPELASI
jgi:hypothetical protein